MAPSPSTVSYPPPEPPVILPAETVDNTTLTALQSQPAYVPFLSHAPPPPDSWIEVETTLSEYKLHVRLPGFSREGITLATKRRRILRVVADGWENGGGHFERRISFGYDADLVQVRAEFDGVMLRIIVPRRISPVTVHSPRPGPIGRV
jgi:HSP20 family molecular chaperone IbpA